VQRAATLRPKYRFSIQETQKLAPLVLLPIPDTLFSLALKYEETGDSVHMVACNTCLSLYLERMLVRPVSLSLFYRAAQRGASRAPLALSLSLERLSLER
jgi:hypothetical protein